MSTPDVERLRSIKTFPSLVKYLRDELDWPIESDDFDELTFDYEPEELGLDAKTAVQIKDIKQLRPLVTNQPWGIFFVNFEPKRLPVVALRRILRSLVLKKRQSANKAQQATWNLHDLLFISSYGESDHRDITFAHFAEEDGTGDLPTLRVLGWDDEDAVLHLAHADKILRDKLRWPEPSRSVEQWRSRWSSAFTLRPREVIGTAKALAERMAELATAIRKRVNKVLSVESESGPLRKLMTAFREALIHDLKEDDFADMYAQTITYGLLTARVSRPAGLVAENVADMVPITNPFLRDMLSTFLTVGGRKGKIDFDELGVNDVVQALRDADMEAVLRDFGDKNPQEDPVIHFYEYFLKEYDPVKRIKRGIFFTPRPVVSFIVRSVDEILRREFGLEDGLADTTTWGEMAQRHKDLKIPEGVAPKEPFVQILDPACGTGTFLVEVIDVIHRTMKAKWHSVAAVCDRRPGPDPQFQDRWNEYVSDHLLPRLYGFELMMAPYAIAHMKLGLKLHETGYNFRSHERARIYLTNTLEPPQDFSDRFEFDAPALAHEAHAVNAIKRGQLFAVVIGNPPYSGVSANKGRWIASLIEDYRKADGKPLGERKTMLDDDYVKFIRFGQWRIQRTDRGVLALITNNAWTDNPTFRGMRQSLLGKFTKVYILNLHGDSKRKEICPDGSKDENIFDIQQGVAISTFLRNEAKDGPASVNYSELWGLRELKYEVLCGEGPRPTVGSTVSPLSPFYLFVPHDKDLSMQHECDFPLPGVFPLNSTGITTSRDELVVDIDKEALIKRMTEFIDPLASDEDIRSRFHLNENYAWRVSDARTALRKAGEIRDLIRHVFYRPFDVRYICYDPSVVWRVRENVMNHLDKPNLALMSMRRTRERILGPYFVVAGIVDRVILSSLDNSHCFPLYMYEHGLTGQAELAGGVSLWPPGPGGRRPNLNPEFVAKLEKRFVLRFVSDGKGDLRKTFGPEDVFHYIYAIFHSPACRTRYAEFLRTDFPRVPLSCDFNLFRALHAKGADLVALHLLEDDYPSASWNTSRPKGESPLQNLITQFAGKDDAEVAKGYPKFVAAVYDRRSVGSISDRPIDNRRSQTAATMTGNVYINPSRWFEGVPENVWNFHIGGYQVCEKWLKDRRSRTLSDEDVLHYQRVVVALNETIRLMAEIDKVIEAHGGWPAAFMTSVAKAQG